MTARRLVWVASVLGAIGCKQDRAAPPPLPPPMPPPAPDVREPAPAPPPVTGPGWATSARIVEGHAQASSLAIDSKGDVVIAVGFDKSITVGGAGFDGGEGGVVLMKITTTGAVAWSKQLAKDELLEDVQVVVDATDAIALTATLRGTVDLGGGPLTSAGDKDIVVAKLGPDGAHQWSHRYGSVAPDRPAGIAIDAKGDIAVAGYYQGVVDFGGRTLKATGHADMFVAHFTAAGRLGWVSRLSGGGEELSELYDVAVDRSGNVIAVGAFGDVLDVGGKKLAGDKARSSQTFVTVFAPTGKLVRTGAYGPGTLTLGHVVTTDGAGNVVLAGAVLEVPVDDNHMIAIDPATGATQEGSMTGFVAELAPDLKPRWHTTTGPIAMGDGVELAVAPDDAIIAAGTGPGAPFGDSSLETAKVYAARISTAGEPVWVRAIPDGDPFGIPQVAARGDAIVVAARIEPTEGEPALALLRPE